MWLKQSGKPVAFTLVPMIFVLVITLWALVDISYSSYQQTTGFDASLLNAVFSAILIVLALFVAGQFLLKIKTKRVEMPGTATSP